MKVAIIVDRPTQFDAPFFRFASGDSSHALRVFFTRPATAEPVFDPELGRTVSWGFDLLEGYSHAALPARGRGAWLRNRLRAERPDLVIVNGYTQRSYLSAALAARRAGAWTALRIDSVLFDGGDASRLKTALFSLVLLRLFDTFLATGTLTREYLAACGVPAERVGLFPYAIDVEHFHARSRLDAAGREALRHRWGVPPGARVVLAIAKLSPREVPWDLLRAVALQRHTGTFLVLGGDGPLRGEVERFIKESGLASVRLVGYVPYAELPAHYGAADVFVHAPREERWGVSVAEALASGLPVVASARVGAGRDLITIGRNGFIYDAGDERALARLLREALTSLPRDDVQSESSRILARWDYRAAWSGILAVAEAHARP